jgi:hypothetical protein
LWPFSARETRRTRNTPSPKGSELWQPVPDGREAGGLTVGVLPTAGPGPGYPNRWVLLPIYTGSGSARNAFNVLSADLCVAIGGGAGTLSEIGLALKGGRPVWCYRSWTLSPPPGTDRALPRIFENEDDLLASLESELRKS